MYLAGSAETNSAKHEIEAFIRFLIFAVFFSAAVVNQILNHLDEKAVTAVLPQCRAPPTGLFD